MAQVQEHIPFQTAYSMKSEVWGAPFKCMICGALHSDKRLLGQHSETCQAGEVVCQVAAPCHGDPHQSMETFNNKCSSHPPTSSSHLSLLHGSHTSKPIRGPEGHIFGWIRTPTIQNSGQIPDNTYHQPAGLPVMSLPPMSHGNQANYNAVNFFYYSYQPDGSQMQYPPHNVEHQPQDPSQSIAYYNESTNFESSSNDLDITFTNLDHS